MKIKLAALTLIFAAFGIFAGEAQAQSSSVYLSPATGTFFVGGTFDVSVFVNTEGNSINAVEINLDFPADLLQVTSPTAGKSFISVLAGQPFYSNIDGKVSFRGGVPSPGINTSSGLVSTITFRVKSPGLARVYLSESSRVLLADGKGTNILKTRAGGEYLLTLAPPEGPKVSSPTHYCLTCWYKNNNPTFSWQKEARVDDFSFSLDQDPSGIPDNIPEGFLSSATFSDTADGVWYFHLKAKKGNAWGGVSHYPVKIDNTPPKDFKIKIEKIGDRFFAYFETSDQLSGIDHYEVSTVDMSDPQAIVSPFFTESDTLYQIPYTDSGKYAIIIRAYDKAGNYTEQKSTLAIVNPFISYTEGGVRLRGLFLPAWLIWLIIAAASSSLAVIVYRLRRNKNLAQRLKKEVKEAEKEIEDVRKMEEKIRRTRILEEEAVKEEKRLKEKFNKGP